MCLESMVGLSPMIMSPRDISKRTVTTTPVRAFPRCVLKFSESRVGVDQINYEDTFYLFKDKGQTKFQHTASYHPASFRLAEAQQLPAAGTDSDGFRYVFYDLDSGPIYIRALSVFISDLTATRLCTPNGHYSREINLTMISIQLFGVSVCFRDFSITLISTPEIFLSKLVLRTSISNL